jgi:3-hydroxybutyryl-CoA dehydrogenase
MPMLNEAALVLAAGLASKEDIHRGMHLGTKQPLGPLALADLIGLDTMPAICECLQRERGDDKHRLVQPSPIPTSIAEQS